MRKVTMAATLNPNALIEARQKQGLTQVQLSEATKPRIVVSTISRIERGKQTRVREGTLKELARALAVSPEDLSTKRPTEREVMKLRIGSAARNALTLVARRYQVSREQVIEAAPLLFFIIAEQSLQQRRKRLDELREAEDAARGVALPHLPYYPGDSRALDFEARSIKARDLFGAIVADKVGRPDDPHWREETGNPFASFLNEALGASESDEFVGWAPHHGPSYAICEEEVAALVGGDADAQQAIFNGDAALHEMPAEVRKSSPAEKAKWASEKLTRWNASLEGLI
jgi:transcriptional regulator with XRE-family HTH domain